MSDRICIHSNETEIIRISADDLVSCCGIKCGFGCYGGIPENAWKYWLNVGIVTGGLYDSKDGCRPYEIPPCEHHSKGSLPECKGNAGTPKCTRKCVDGYNVTYEDDKRYGN